MKLHNGKMNTNKNSTYYVRNRCSEIQPTHRWVSHSNAYITFINMDNQNITSVFCSAKLK